MDRLFSSLLICLLFSCAEVNVIEEIDENNAANVNVASWIAGSWEDRTTFSDIKLQFNLLEKEVIAIMKANLKRTSFLNWRKRVRGRKTKIQDLSDRFRSKKQKSKY